MYQEDSALAEECERLARETGAAVEWLEQNSEAKGRDLEIEGHKKELRKAGRLFYSCAVAARRKMCVGVFGPSQAGKSYLVSTLAGNRENSLWTQLGDTVHDFLCDINPAGGKESTGLVTRFTLNRPVEPPAGYPVHVRLLSFVDVVKILANTYFSDAEHMEAPNRDAMLIALKELEKRKTNAPTGGLDPDDVEDLQEYIHKYFRSKPRAQQLLDQHFWDRVIPLAPCLSDTDRAELFSLIWDGVAPFTGLLRQLAATLRTLGFASEVFCQKNVLLPRTSSIIDVATLGELVSVAGDDVSVSTRDGLTATLPRVFITALTAELVIPMRDKPADFFDHTDLLDFPGYRSRRMFIDLHKEAEDPVKLKECFLRGKVAYLFERYCAERELTSLLLCIGNGVQEVQGLGGAVNDWLTSTHGGTPERRTGKDIALFFVLTKSDLEFEDKAGAKDVSKRWETRIGVSKEIFTSHEWPKKWDSSGPFRNFFLMRNPTVKTLFFEHDENGHETSLKQEQLSYVQKFEQAFMDNPDVNKYFLYKEETWKAFLAPNDGGLSLIRAKLAPICKPELKREQIKATLEERLAKINNFLSLYWHTDDKQEERRQKNLLGHSLAKVMVGMYCTRRFGAFVRMLTVPDQNLYDLYFQAQHQMQEELAAVSADPVPLEETVGALLKKFLGKGFAPESSKPAPEQSGAKSPSPIQPKDEVQAFAKYIEKYWIEGLHTFADDPVLQAYFSFPPSLFAQFIHELRVGFMRLGMRAILEKALRNASNYTNVGKERLVWKQAGLAAGIINQYVCWLGFSPHEMSEQQRTVLFGGEQRLLFEAPPDFENLPPLGEQRTDYMLPLTMDWSAALWNLMNENVNFDGARSFDPEQNDRLRGILDSLCIREQ